MDDKTLALLIKGGGNLISYFIGNQPLTLSDAEVKATESLEKYPIKNHPAPEKSRVQSGVSTAETIAYQKREISKELLLMEKHLQQRCKINGTACDCCNKHPLAIEALSQEALGMTGDSVYGELAEWSKEVMPLTTPEASASGLYEERYPELAVEAREMRKRIMGTADIMPLLDPKQQKMLKEAISHK